MSCCARTRSSTAPPSTANDHTATRQATQPPTGQITAGQITTEGFRAEGATHDRWLTDEVSSRLRPHEESDPVGLVAGDPRPRTGGGASRAARDGHPRHGRRPRPAESPVAARDDRGVLLPDDSGRGPGLPHRRAPPCSSATGTRPTSTARIAPSRPSCARSTSRCGRSARQSGYRTLQEAVDAVKQPGQTIKILPGRLPRGAEPRPDQRRSAPTCPARRDHDGAPGALLGAAVDLPAPTRTWSRS